MRCFRTGRFLQKSPAGKGVWSEKPMAGFALLFESVAKKLGQKHEMIIMNPDQRSTIGSFGNRICEQLIYPPICLPWSLVENYTGLIMENRPEDTVRRSAWITMLGHGSLLENPL